MRYELRPRLSLDDSLVVTECATGRVLHAERRRDPALSLAALSVAIAVGGGGIWSVTRVLAGGPLAAGVAASLAAGIFAWVRCCPRRHITVYADDACTEPLLWLRRASSGFLEAVYEVSGPEGVRAARLSKEVGRTGLRSWALRAGDLQVEAAPQGATLSGTSEGYKVVAVLLGVFVLIAFRPWLGLLLLFLLPAAAYLARGVWLHGAYEVTDAEGAPLAAFRRRGLVSPTFVLEVGDARLGPNEAVALGCVLAMDPRGTG